MVRGSPQPHVEPWLIATSTATSHDDSSAAPTQLTRPGDLTGDSGTKKKVAIVAMTTRDEREPEQPVVGERVDDRAREHDAQPPPMPRIAEISAIPCATRSRGNSSRMIPNASGKIAPPAPWMTRPTISTPMLLASAATSDPNAEE